jgi:hypothetical protein
VVDVCWWLLVILSGREALAFFAVAAVCVYAMVRTWRDQRHYG